jgi:hypothetical protein
MSRPEDWRCGYHNRPFALGLGRMTCDSESGFCMMIQPDEVALIMECDSPFTFTLAGHPLRNAMNPIIVSDDDEPHIKAHKTLQIEWLTAILEDDAVQWWHMYGGDMWVLPETAEEHHGPVWTTAMIGPVLEDAHSVVPGTGRPVSAGIDLDSGGHASHMALLGSWTHDPTDEEKQDAQGKGLAAKVIRDLHAGDVRVRDARDVDAAGIQPIYDI